ncbi:MAG: hypothetical protein ABI224_03125 [Acetobacteraceae bacterium]
MHRLLMALALIATASPALAAGRGGGEPAIANDTTTSMGQPMGSPFYAAPRSAGVPDTPANRHALELGQNPVVVARCGSFQPKPGCHPTP